MTAKKSSLKFRISFPGERSKTPIDGRVLLLISNNADAEPRFQISNTAGTQLVFGVDVDGLKPNKQVIIDADVLGYPLDSVADIPKGTYWVQALLHKYETFNRADGHTVKLPMDQGEGQKWNRAPGNIYSTPRRVKISPRARNPIDIVLDQEIPPFPDYEDTKYLKHISMKSKLLSKFWGRDWYLGAFVLLPEGFDENPDMKYPMMVHHNHFRREFSTPTKWRETPFSEDEVHTPSGIQYFPGYWKLEQKYAYKFYQDWTKPNYPRYLLVTLQHPTPYFDDSYGVNSQITGPFGDAIVHELIPYIEKKFRGIGEGWARVSTGGSTGGWISLAQQVLYPDEFNGCWANCPDPVDFRAMTTVNIYDDDNAYYYPSTWKRTARPQERSTEGTVNFTHVEHGRLEHVLGTKGRSGGEPNCWMTVYGPVGPDGYPRLLWDKLTGEIDKEVAEYWRENYDLKHIMERDWETLGPKLKGKIRIYMGDMDALYYTRAAYLIQEFLESTKDPYYDGIVEIGDRFGHCYSGDPATPQMIGRLTGNQRVIGEMVQQMLSGAPEGADTRWKGDWPVYTQPPRSEWRSVKYPGWHADVDKKLRPN